MMSDRGQREDSRANRIARYKEERRQQLSSQIQARLAGENQKGSTGSESPHGFREKGTTDGPRATRTSRLRAAASAVNENGSLKSPGTPEKSWERTHTPPSPMVSGSKTIISTLDKDKSNKRKSNLNKSLYPEDSISQNNSEDDKFGRRRKRSHETLDNSHQTFKSPIAKDTKSTFSFSSSYSKKISVEDSNSMSSQGAIKSTPKKSQLAIHMENARKSLKGKAPDNFCKKQNVKNASPSSSEENSHKLLNGIFNNDNELAKFNGENTKQSTNDNSRKSRDHRDNEHRVNMNRLNNLTNLTKETLARVERLTNRSKNTPTRDSPKKTPETSRRIRGAATSSKSSSDEKTGPSLLRRMNFEESHKEPSAAQQRNSSPVSILKRKTPVDDGKPETSTHTPPVTFSPSVKEPSTSNKRQGILKKRRSLDEALVLRRRSCSPEVASKSDSKSILKTHRRSSLEELTRIHSPEAHLQSILKRKSSKNEDEHDQSFNSPQSILKRRSGASSAGSTVNTTPHVSITTAVILAAASGAEMVLESKSTPFRPILKKKSISDDQSLSDNSHSDTPRPILKKKTSNESDDCDEKLRPILKLRGSLDRESDKTGSGLPDNDTEFRPILKQSKEDLSRSRFSFCEENGTYSGEDVRRQQRNARRSNTICADYTSVVLKCSGDERSILKRQRPSSVIELNNVSSQAVSPLAFTGAIPKRNLMSRSSEKFEQHFVFTEEKRKSSSYAASSSNEQLCNQYSHLSIQKEEFTDFPSQNLNSDLDSCSKVSTDTAFQSLMYGLEPKDNDSKFPEDCSSKFVMDSNGESYRSGQNVPNISITSEPRDVKRHPVTFCGIEESRTKDEESSIMDKTTKKKTGSISADRTKGNRHSTQPVTSDEIREASKMQPDDPSNLSLSERIKIFNTKITKEIQKNHALG